MKNYSLFVSLIFLLSASACQMQPATTASPQTNVPSEMTEMGGISGGGGGTLPADPSSVYEVNEIVSGAKPSLRLLANFYDDKQFPKLLGTLEQKLYQGPVTVRDLIETIDVEVRMNAPCYDSGHNEVDGSIFANRPNTICISAFRIAPKVDRERVRNEVEALMMHEFSHLLGTTEPEAIQFQKYTKQSLDNETDNGNKIYLNDSNDLMNQLTSQTRKLANLTFVDARLMDEAIPLEVTLSTLTGQIKNKIMNYETNQALFGEKDRDYLNLLFDRLSFASLYSFCHSTSPDVHPSCDLYEKRLNHGESVTDLDYWTSENLAELAAGDFSHELIKRIHDQNEYKIQIAEVTDALSKFSPLVFSMIAMQPLPVAFQDQASQVNPWGLDHGVYSVVSKNCVGANPPEATMTGFEIFARDARWMMKRTYAYGFSEIGLNTGDADVNTSGASIGKDAHGVYRTSESGDLWNFDRVGSRISNYHLTTDGPNPTLTVTNDDKSGFNTSTETPVFTHSECVFQLKRVP